MTFQLLHRRFRKIRHARTLGARKTKAILTQAFRSRAAAQIVPGLTISKKMIPIQASKTKMTLPFDPQSEAGIQKPRFSVITQTRPHFQTRILWSNVFEIKRRNYVNISTCTVLNRSGSYGRP